MYSLLQEGGACALIFVSLSQYYYSSDCFQIPVCPNMCLSLSVVILTIILRHVLQSAIFCMQATNLFDAVITMKYIKSRKTMRTFEMILKILTYPLLTVDLQ